MASSGRISERQQADSLLPLMVLPDKRGNTMAGKMIRARKNALQERMAEMVKGGALSLDSSGDFRIPNAEWSDYGGSVYDRANAAYLAGEYADVVQVSNYGGHGWQGAWISKSILNDAPFGEGGTRAVFARLPEVLDMIDCLTEYPVISEESVYEVEAEILAESWDGFYRQEFSRELSERLEKECPACIAWEASEYGSGVPQCPIDHSDFTESAGFNAFAELVGDSEFKASEVEYAADMSEVVDAYLSARKASV